MRLVVALGIGLIVGIERGWRQREEQAGGRTAGVRTFAIIGILGGLMGALSMSAGSSAPWIAGMIVLTAAFGVFSYREGKAENDFSVTGVVVAMTVFALGVLAVVGDVRTAGAVGVILVVVLASREHLHRAVARLTWVELRSALLLLAMTAVVLPLLPDRPIDPLGALNPRELWLLMILTGAVSYAGYAALKIAGPKKGPPIAGLAGGLASSTAATLALARLSRGAPDSSGLGAGAAFAAMVSLIRATALAIALQPALAPLLAAPVAAAAVTFAVGGLVGLARSRSAEVTPVADGVPFEALAVLSFGVLLAAVMLLSAWVGQVLGGAGSYAFAAITGFVDVDAITLASARSAARGASLTIAANSILLAFAANALQRVVVSWSFGAAAFSRLYAIVSAAALCAGLLAFVLTR